VLVAAGPELTVRDLPEPVQRHAAAAPAARPAANGRAAANGHSLLQSRADYERRLIQQTLEECRFNRSSAARALGISRVTLHKKIKQYGLTALPLTGRGR